MGGADTLGGGGTPVEGAAPITPGNVGRRPMGVAQPPPGPVAVQTLARPHDPLSVPYLLPSRSMYYQDLCPGHDGRVVIAPMRGEQEEIIAGAAQNPQAQGAALRHVTEQCIDTRGIPFRKLLVDDWTASMLHFLALSAGSDVIGLRPTCPHEGCKQQHDQSKALTSLACTILRFAEQGETVEPETEHDPAEDVIADIDGESEEGGVSEIVLTPETAAEPFTTKPLPIGGQKVSWRYHRLEDLEKAEEFAARMETERSGKPGSPLHSYLMALQIAALDGTKQATLQAWRWVKAQPSVNLSAWREEMAERSFGYDVMMRFRCKGCGRSFRARLPLDGSLFRRRTHS